MKSTLLMFMLVIAALVSNSAQAQWGNLKAKFVVKGDVPKPAKLDASKEAFCLKHADDIIDESLLVSKDGGLKNVLVSLVPGTTKVTPHESYAAAAKGEVEVDNSKCRFEPHIVTMQTSQTLLIKNSDPMGHNSKIDLFSNNAVNPIVPAGGSVKLNFPKAESRPMPLSCSIHPWMSAHILIKDDPYVALSDADGNLEIKNLPAGAWTFMVWHERPAYVTTATVGGKPVEWKKGRATFTIKAGETTDVGDVVLTVDQLKQK